ncbi:hypothetical protein OEB96_00605, partial [Paraliomyxa miuraensis]|nr:hypothetical protein [Paraliomyxa miuraensis]
MFIDTALPSDGAREIIEATFRLPSSPLLIAMGLTSDSASTTFALAKTGVHANSDAIWAPVPAEPGRLFRRTWARIPE